MLVDACFFSLFLLPLHFTTCWTAVTVVQTKNWPDLSSFSLHCPLDHSFFTLQVALFELQDVTLLVHAYQKHNIHRKELIGWLALGANSSGEEQLAHWNDMMEAKGDQVSFFPSFVLATHNRCKWSVDDATDAKIDANVHVNMCLSVSHFDPVNVNVEPCHCLLHPVFILFHFTSSPLLQPFRHYSPQGLSWNNNECSKQWDNLAKRDNLSATVFFSMVYLMTILCFLFLHSQIDVHEWHYSNCTQFHWFVLNIWQIVQLLKIKIEKEKFVS